MRKARHDGRLYLLIGEDPSAPWRRWDVLALDDGQRMFLAEKWLLHDTVAVES